VFRHLQEQRKQRVGPDNREHLLAADSSAGAPFLDNLPRQLGRRLLPVATLRQGALHFLSCVNPPFANVALSFPHHLLKARIGLDSFHSFSRWRVRAYEHFCSGGRHGAVCGTGLNRTRPACLTHGYSIARPHSPYQGTVCKTYVVCAGCRTGTIERDGDGRCDVISTWWASSLYQGSISTGPNHSAVRSRSCHDNGNRQLRGCALSQNLCGRSRAARPLH